MEGKKHLFFDLDRTLWDFDTNSKEALRELFEEQKLDLEVGDFQNFLKVYEEVNEECWKFYRMGQLKKEVLRVKRFRDTLLKLDFPNEKVIGFFADQYVKRSPLKKNLLPGTLEVLEHLSHQNYVLHIITNGFKEIQHLKLKNTEIDVYFDTVLCSEETGAKKPHPKVFHAALELARSTSRESLMIGDDLEADIQGAQKVGMEAIWYNSSSKMNNTEEHIFQINELQELKNIL